MKLTSLEKSLNYTFKKIDYLEQALVHKSYFHEQKSEHNERMEYLGDAVVDLVISDLVYRTFPEDTEGTLSKKRANLVNEAMLSQLATQLELQNYIKLGKGEMLQKGQNKPSILASTLEAIFAAIYLDQGYQEAHRVIQDLFKNDLHEVPLQDSKSNLQELVQKKFKTTPKYELLDLQEQKFSKVRVTFSDLNQKVHTFEAIESSRKRAEHKAAELALEKLGTLS